MFVRVFNHFKRKIIKIYERNHYYKMSYKELYKKLKVSKSKRIWFIGSAHYDNIGDLAISEATIKFLEKYQSEDSIIEIRLCDYSKYEKAMEKLIMDEDLIVLQGGGNIGFAYFEAELNRRMVINKFKNNKIIIFPSTIDYGNTWRERLEYKNSIKIYNKHKNLIICAREKKSYDIMTKIYKNVILVPDIVLSLEPKNYFFDRNKIIICLRKDKEKTMYADKLQELLVLSDNYFFTDNVSKEKNISIKLRKDIFEKKLKELSKAKIVITDRLHAMIFCYLTETPCLFIDNTNKKISGVYNLWIKEKCNYIKELEIDSGIENQIDSLLENIPIHVFDASLEFQKLIKYLEQEMKQ